MKLQDEIEDYLVTLDDEVDTEYYCTERERVREALYGFLAHHIRSTPEWQLKAMELRKAEAAVAALREELKLPDER